MKRMMMATNEERGPLVGVGLQQHPQRRPLLIRLFFSFFFFLRSFAQDHADFGVERRTMPGILCIALHRTRNPVNYNAVSKLPCPLLGLLVSQHLKLNIFVKSLVLDTASTEGRVRWLKRTA